MKVLVTGGTGFIGSHSVKALKDAGHWVRVLIRSPEKARTVFENLGVEPDDIVQGDIVDEDSVKKAVEGCDAVIHTAAMVSTAEKHAEQLRQVNVGGTKNVIDCSLAAGVKKIIYVSSVSALFNVNDASMNEDTPVSNSETPYGRTKVSCENYVRELQSKGAPIITTYPTGVVGLDDPALSEPHFGLKMFIGQFTFTSSTGLQFVNVRDIAKAHVLILERCEGPDKFILGGCYYTWFELLEVVNKLTGRNLFSIHIPGKALRFFGKVTDFIMKWTGIEFPISAEGAGYATQWVYADSSKIEKELAFEFTGSEQTMKEVIQFLYKNGHLSAKKAGKLAN